MPPRASTCGYGRARRLSAYTAFLDATDQPRILRCFPRPLCEQFPPDVVKKATGASSAGGPPADGNAQSQDAFRQGYEYAVQQFGQQQAQEQAALQQRQLNYLQQSNEDHERKVAEHTQALRAREYRCGLDSPAAHPFCLRTSTPHPFPVDEACSLTAYVSRRR